MELNERKTLIDFAFGGVHRLDTDTQMSLLKYVAFEKVGMSVVEDFLNESPAYRRGIKKRQ